MSSLKCRSNKSQPLWSLLREIYVLVETQEFVFSLRIPSGSSQTASEQKHLNSPYSCTQAHLQSPITSPGVIFPATSTAHLAANRSCIKRLAAIHRFLLRMPSYRYSAPLCLHAIAAQTTNLTLSPLLHACEQSCLRCCSNHFIIEHCSLWMRLRLCPSPHLWNSPQGDSPCNLQIPPITCLLLPT